MCSAPNQIGLLRSLMPSGSLASGSSREIPHTDDWLDLSGIGQLELVLGCCRQAGVCVYVCVREGKAASSR